MLEMGGIYFAWAGGEAHGPLPDAGGVLDQAAVMWDALAEMGRAHHRLRARRARRD